MKIAHFAIFAPHASGQYATVKDLILAERSLGIDAQFVDCGTDKKDTVREGLEDGPIKTVPLSWAIEKADILIRHTSIPSYLYKVKPVVLSMHGRPESSFRLEQTGQASVISAIRDEIKKGCYKAIFTFWQEHAYYWKTIHGVGVNYVSAPVNLEEFTIDGEQHDFSGRKGEFNIIIADMWRDDQTPFNLIFAAKYFRDKYCNNAKLHLYGVPNVKKKHFAFLADMQKEGFIGEVGGVVEWISKVYRSADVILTPNIIATRIIRESMASGLPIVAPHGCAYTPFQAEPRDYKSFAAEIEKCRQTTNGDYRLGIRKQAEKLFNPVATGEKVKQICEKVLSLKPKTVSSSELIAIGQKYCETVNGLERKAQRTMRKNERAIEIAYVFKKLTEYYPSTILDVGSGESSLPHLMGSVRFEVDAIDAKGDYWRKGMFNRHYHIEQQDILNHTIKRHYDFITCVSTLEHIPDHQTAVKNMLDLLNPGGVLLITAPYNEEKYIPNVYLEKGAGYGKGFPYICQVFSRAEVESWGGKVLDQEYWRVFSGPYWTFGRQLYPPIQTNRDSLHQLTCMLLGKP